MAPIVRDFTRLTEPEKFASDVLSGIHAAGNPFYDWFFGGHEAAREVLGKWVVRPSSEISFTRVKLLFEEDRPVGGFLGLSGAELVACRKADMLGLLQNVKKGSIDLSERFAAARALFPRVAPDVYYLSKIWINPDFRGEGRGKELLAAYLEEGRSRGLTTFQLEVSADNDSAIQLYRSCGFEVAQTACFVQGNLEYLSMRLEEGRL